MKSIKALFVAMAFAMATVFAFAFNTSEVEPEAELKTELQTHLYGNTGNGSYTKIDGPLDPNGCEIPDNFPCILVSEEDVDDFDWADRPEDSAPLTPGQNRVYL